MPRFDPGHELGGADEVSGSQARKGVGLGECARRDKSWMVQFEFGHCFVLNLPVPEVVVGLVDDDEALRELLDQRTQLFSGEAGATRIAQVVDNYRLCVLRNQLERGIRAMCVPRRLVGGRAATDA